MGLTRRSDVDRRAHGPLGPDRRRFQELVEKRPPGRGVGDHLHRGVAPRDGDVEDAAFLFDVVGERVGHEPVVRAEHDDVRPLHPLHAVHGRQRDAVARRPLVGRASGRATTARTPRDRVRRWRPR